jgi:predicted nucleic acid-binding Zn ribbon protein
LQYNGAVFRNTSIAMPTYDYLCPANGRIVEVSHKMAEQVSTWGELCRRAGLALDGTPGNAKVERLITGGAVLTGSLGSAREVPCDTGPCGAPVCGGGGCAYN